MNCIVFGKTGQIGHALVQGLAPLGTVHAFGRADFDLTDFAALRDCIQAYRPDVIVNAAAYTAVDQAEREVQLAQQMNADVVAVLASVAISCDALLVHYSTDYVFDGEKATAYVESDTVNPLNVYGRTKRAGELAVLDSTCRALILRTSWVYSVRGMNFIKTILRLAKTRDTLRVVADQFGAPTSADWIATTTADIIRAYNHNQLAGGLVHLTANGVTSWYALACYVVERARALGMLLRLAPHCIEPITSLEYPMPAVRPKNSRLDTSLVSGGLQRDLEDWRVHVDRTVMELTQMECVV